MISGRRSSLMLIFSKSDSHRSGVIIGQSDPNKTFLRRIELQYFTKTSGKYLGDHPDRSIYTFGLSCATDSASSCHGKLGCAKTIFMSGKSTATSSIYIGLEYFRRMPLPPRIPDPTPV